MMPTIAGPALSHGPIPASADSRADSHPTLKPITRQACTFAVQVSDHSSALVDMILDKTRDGSFDVSHAPEQITQALGESWSR